MESQQQIYDEIEIRLYSHSGKGYEVEIELPYGGVTGQLPANLDALDPSAPPREYGSNLSRWLFQGQLRDAFIKAQALINAPDRATANTSSANVYTTRLRLWLDPDDELLQQVYWESLYGPEGQAPLSTSTAFSRYIRSSAARGWFISERPLNILMLQAALPQGAATSADLNEVSKQLAAFITDQDSSPTKIFQVEQLELAQLGPAGLSGFHIVQITAQTAMQGDQCLLRVNNGGQAELMTPREIAASLVGNADQAPHLIVLLTDSADEAAIDEMEMHKASTQFALQLCENGVQAVITIHTPMEQATLLHFMRQFYAVLMRTGVIDVAVSAARRRIYVPTERAWTYPVLNMRIPQGQLFTPFSESRSQQDRSIYKE